MQKATLHSQTHTLDTQASQSNQNSSRNYKTSSGVSTTYTPQSKGCYQSSCPDQAGGEVIEHESDLNTSGVNNNTIYECLQLLSNNEISFAQENSSLHSLLSDEEKQNLRRRLTSSKIRSDSKIGIDQIPPEERFRARSIGVVNLASNSRLANSGANKSKNEKNTSGNMKPEASKKRKDVNSAKSCDKEKKSGKLDVSAKAKVAEQKAHLKESIYKITRASSHNYDPESPLISATVTSRMDKERLSVCKGYETVNLTSRLATSPLTERESHIVNKAGFLKSATRGTSPNSTKEKMNKSKTETSNPFLRDRYQTALSKKSSDAITPCTTSLNHSAQPKKKPLTVSISKNLHTSMTPRAEKSSQKNENQKPGEVRKDTAKKNEKKDNGKSENKGKKEMKTLKATKVDFVEVNLHRKTTRKLKEEKMEECLEKIEEMYEKLKKGISEKKDVLVGNDNFLHALEALKNCMGDAQGLLKC